MSSATQPAAGSKEKRFEDCIALLRGPGLEQRVAGLFLLTRALALKDCARGPVLDALTDGFLASCLGRDDLLPVACQVASWLCEDPSLALKETASAAVNALGGATRALAAGDAAELARVALSEHGGALPGPARCLALVLAAGGACACPSPLVVLLGRSVAEGPSPPLGEAVCEVARGLARGDEGKFPSLFALALLAEPPPEPAWVEAARVPLKEILRSKLGPAERAAALIVLSMAVGVAGLADYARGDVAFLRLVIGLARVEIAVELERKPEDRSTGAVVACFAIVESFVGTLVGDDGDELAAVVAPDLAAVDHYRQLLSDIFSTILAYVADKAENEGQGSLDPVLDPAIRVLLLWLLDETDDHREAVANVAPFLAKRCLAPGSVLAPIFLRAVPALASSQEVALALSPEAGLIEAALEAGSLRVHHRDLYDDIKDLLEKVL